MLSLTAQQTPSFEQQLLNEINLLREHPTYYAKHIVLPYAAYYSGRQLRMPGKGTITTKEGLRALHECVKVLYATKPMPPFQYSSDLSAAACIHIADQSRSGRTGHIGGNGSSVADRIELFVHWEKQIAENIFYGKVNVRQAVVLLLIDDGVSDRGHRKNFLNRTLRYLGAAKGYHPIYSKMIVIDFAGGIEDKKD